MGEGSSPTLIIIMKVHNLASVANGYSRNSNTLTTKRHVQDDVSGQDGYVHSDIFVGYHFDIGTDYTHLIKSLARGQFSHTYSSYVSKGGKDTIIKITDKIVLTTEIVDDYVFVYKHSHKQQTIRDENEAMTLLKSGISKFLYINDKPSSICYSSGEEPDILNALSTWYASDQTGEDPLQRWRVSITY